MALLDERKAVFTRLRSELQTVAAEFGERVLDTPQNPISLGQTFRLDQCRVCTCALAHRHAWSLVGSYPCVASPRLSSLSIAMTLATVERDLRSAGKDVTFFGSMLFTRCVSGTRWVADL